MDSEVVVSQDGHGESHETHPYWAFLDHIRLNYASLADKIYFITEPTPEIVLAKMQMPFRIGPLGRGTIRTSLDGCDSGMNLARLAWMELFVPDPPSKVRILIDVAYAAKKSQIQSRSNLFYAYATAMVDRYPFWVIERLWLSIMDMSIEDKFTPRDS